MAKVKGSDFREQFGEQFRRVLAEYVVNRSIYGNFRVLFWAPVDQISCASIETSTSVDVEKSLSDLENELDQLLIDAQRAP